MDSSNLRYFINYILAPIVLVSGLLGNTLGYLVLCRKKLDKIGPIYVYKFLLLMDTLYLIQIVASSLQYSYNIGLAIWSSLNCRIYIYFNYAWAAVSPWLMVYILFERLVSIMLPAFRFVLRETDPQVFFSVMTFVCISGLYVPIPMFNDVQVGSTADNTTKVVCDFISPKSRAVLSYFDLILRVLLPSFIMLTCSIMLISKFFQMRSRIRHTFTLHYSRFQREITLAVSSLAINLIFICLNLPFALTLFLPKLNNFSDFVLTFYVYYGSYAINFYVMYATNKLFRNEFHAMVKSWLGKP